MSNTIGAVTIIRNVLNDTIAIRFEAGHNTVSVIPVRSIYAIDSEEQRRGKVKVTMRYGHDLQSEFEFPGVAEAEDFVECIINA